MRLAIAEAERALSHDDVPVGALVLGPTGEVLGAGHNERERLQDPSAHAELLAIRAAAAAVGSWRLLDDFLPKLRAVTPADVQRVARQYFAVDRKNVSILLPAAPAAAAAR